ncbi:MAG TPA: hypothetical protein PLB78_18830, partial [Anaerolineae bacterium]|nr:hypothetical protein [Anaerolineae bacterium]
TPRGRELAPAVRAVLDEWAGYIGQETLSRRLVAGRPPEGAYVERQRVDGSEVTFGIVQAPEAN